MTSLIERWGLQSVFNVSLRHLGSKIFRCHLRIYKKAIHQYVKTFLALKELSLRDKDSH